MVEKKTSEHISEDEAALYDRQIRLWGLDAQNRLRNASVLLVGVNGLGAEVAKNLMLAGLKSLTLMDGATVTKTDFNSQFFCPVDSVGQNRASASLARCQELNPMVDVKIEECNLDSKDPSYFSQFDLVCLINQSPKQMDRVDRLCRDAGVRFCSGAIFGWIAFAFSDFLDFEFADEVKKSKTDMSAEILLDAPDAKKRRIDADLDEETGITKSRISFPSFNSAFNASWAVKGVSARTKKLIPDGYFIVKALLNYWNSTGELCVQSGGGDPKMLDTISEVWKQEISACQRALDTVKTNPAEFLPYCCGELSPVCAIVGGVMGQEIIKALSQKDAPLNNTFIYNGIATNGTVIQLPPKTQ